MLEGISCTGEESNHNQAQVTRKEAAYWQGRAGAGTGLSVAGEEGTNQGWSNSAMNNGFGERGRGGEVRTTYLCRGPRLLPSICLRPGATPSTLKLRERGGRKRERLPIGKGPEENSLRLTTHTMEGS